ncbi:hypothetical protein CLIB1423_21S01596 [[Candida] railenensis]|uniref:Uncharacterized protein n=1 Tax=[Candida] railenensis TaxID=45579 RepID=A0A9P0QV23_9ASCO|nr:hypothetical protein CLIB1423_21S01596 [[Candida] railenensis]
MAQLSENIGKNLDTSFLNGASKLKIVEHAPQPLISVNCKAPCTITTTTSHSLGYANSAPLMNSTDFDTVIVHKSKSCTIENGCKQDDQVDLITLPAGSSSLVSPPGAESTASIMSSEFPYDLSPRPHSPPYYNSTANDHTDYRTSFGRSIREAVILNRSQHHSPSPTSYFQSIMEERLTRWRPSDSHQSVDATMNGQHPYQIRHFANRDTNSMVAVPFFVNIKEWWKTKNDNTSSIAPIPDPDSHILPIFQQQTASWTYNFSNFMKKIQPHTSDSLVIERNSPKQFISAEPQSAKQLSYTPEAIPYKNFELNFEKRNQDCSTSARRVQQTEYEDDETMNLIGVNENFLTNFIQTSWTCISSIRCQ